MNPLSPQSEHSESQIINLINVAVDEEINNSLFTNDNNVSETLRLLTLTYFEDINALVKL